MKISTLLTFATASLLAFTTTGCKQTPIRTTVLPGHDAAGAALTGRTTPPDLNTPPINTGGSTDGVTAVPANLDQLKGGLPDDTTLEGRDQDRSLFANETVYFEYDLANVRGSEASKADQVAGAFRAKGPGFDLLIEGHCDERGTEEYNRSLGERRALALRELLVKSGVDAAHVFTRSFGKDQPAVPGHDEASWSKNRRGEFILVLPRKLITTQNTK
jgi:peptidoglycan-associated lipoprotein